ncbi:pseudouridylate synthase RPUSD2-like [Centruroides vittatus]|uniref:pseudouridylate synthase RPUSD2-like n=1 Tax=Centruroides vittatus TaxID=120091 RepID=UPI00350EC19D
MLSKYFSFWTKYVKYRNCLQPIRNFNSLHEKHLFQIEKRIEALSGLTDDSFNETEYYFDNGLRKVYPYYFLYHMFCKINWVGEKLLDVITNDYPMYSKEEYKMLIEDGIIRVNKKNVSTDYILKSSDVITHFVHRHEAPVLATPVKLLYKSNDIVVADKPPSIPVHPCGRYRHNSALFILARENNLENLYTIHRLDRLTSGLLIFGLNQASAKNIINQMRDRQVQKEYLCRVEGNFMEGETICKEPILMYRNAGICLVDPNGKKCLTKFIKLSFNGKSSVVLCKPLTGRTHQIRVHLQYLGHPIINDPLYNTDWYGPYKGKGCNYGKSKKELIEDLVFKRISRFWKTEPSEFSRKTG